MNISIQSRVMHMAHKILESNPNMTWSEAVRLAWQLHYFREMLKRGIVKFSYYKINDVILTRVIRPARGTLNLELIPADKQPKDSPLYVPNWSSIAYFDLDVQGWRSFNINCLHTIDSYATLNNVELNEEEE